jgi:hypothetical protein
MTRFIGHAVLAPVVLSLFAAAVFADDWGAPRPHIFACPSGAFGFKTIPGKYDALREPSPTRGVLFTLDHAGQERVVWEKELVNTPLFVHVADTGAHVVTIDSHYNAGGPHSVMLYGPKGVVVADLGLEDLLTKEEIEKHVTQSVSSRWWATGADVRIDDDKKRAVIKLTWGKVIEVSLATGKVRSEQ